MNKIAEHFDSIAKDYDYYKKKNSFYYTNLKKLLRNLIPANKKVLEIGCGTGDLLASLKPKFGYGQDISQEMIKIAKDKYTNKRNTFFSTSWPNEKFNYIFMSDVIEHLENPKKTLTKIFTLMDKNSVFINTMANPIWEPSLVIAEKLKLKMPEGSHTRITDNQIITILNEIGYKIIKHNHKLLIPIKIPIITNFVNKHLEKYLARWSFIDYVVAVRS